MANESMKKYELMVIVDARLSQDDKNATFKEAVDTLTKNGGKIINSQVWLEKHRLTFEIKKCKEGTYYLINYEADGTVNEKAAAMLRINERVLRFVIEKQEPKAAVIAAKPAAAPAAAAPAKA